MELDKQHYNMAAILARYWNYQTPDTDNTRGQLICVFDTDAFLNDPDKDFFTKIKTDTNYLRLKVEKYISSEDPKQQKNNKRANAIFTSLLISKETEKTLNVNKIEKSFLDLLIQSDGFNTEINYNEHQEIIKDFLCLQTIRNPTRYKLILNDYFQKKLLLNLDQFEKNISPPNSFFENYNLLSLNKIEDFLKFSNDSIISNFHDFRPKLNNYLFYTLDVGANFIGDITGSYLDLNSFGINKKEIEKICPNYNLHPIYFNSSLFIPLTNDKILIAMDRALFIGNDIETYKQLIKPLFEKSFINQIMIMYSRYFAFPPEDIELFINNMCEFLQANDLIKFSIDREKNIGYIKNLEYLLNQFRDSKYKIIS